MLAFNMYFIPLTLPNLRLPRQRKAARSVQQKLAGELAKLKQKSFVQLGECFGKFIPSHLLTPSKSDRHSRNRIFSKQNTFWAFLSQVLDAEGGCKEVTLKFQAFMTKSCGKVIACSTSAYCQARKNIDESWLENIFKHLSQQLSHAKGRISLQGRRIIVADGTGLSMPDTVENQEEWPQQKHQKVGCGFPQAALCACFNLDNGALLSYALGNKKSHELPMLRQQSDTFKAGDIFLGDKGFCSYYDQSTFKDKGVDSVVTLARRKPVSASHAVKVIDHNDLLITWPKPKHTKASSYSKDDWEQLPESLPMRQIKVAVSQAGFRVQAFYIVTTLLDPVLYPADEIADLYFERWDVELFFRDIKTTMDMDILRCKSPAMVRKEITMHLIAYNCIQSLIVEAVAHTKQKVRRISFKASLQTIRSWSIQLAQKMPDKERQRLLRLLYQAIAKNVVIERVGRSEPRAVKRRPKNHHLLTAPRHEMKITQHRNTHRAEIA
ncbi:MAG: IS4 family transposase [Ghiorsea sp.]|nr:IS4 family transposase [Ghiorsea sp.]